MEPKLHNDYKLEEAANWLTHHTGKRWSVNAVLSALLEIHIITVGVVLHVGTELTEHSNTENKHVLIQPMQLHVTAPVESFIEGVLLAGCAIPPGLTGKHNNHRYRVSKPIFAVDIRLDKRTVEELLPPVTWLVKLLNDGEFPQLRQDMEELAERDAALALKKSLDLKAQTIATEPKVNTCDGVEDVKVGPLPVEEGLLTKDIAACFDGCYYSGHNWPKRLSATAWLETARIRRGEAGGASAVWNPLTLAQLMHGKSKGKKAKETLMRTLNSRFTKNPALALWRDAFYEYYATHCTTD